MRGKIRVSAWPTEQLCPPRQAGVTARISIPAAIVPTEPTEYELQSAGDHLTQLLRGGRASSSCGLTACACGLFQRRDFLLQFGNFGSLVIVRRFHLHQQGSLVVVRSTDMRAYTSDERFTEQRYLRIHQVVVEYAHARFFRPGRLHDVFASNFGPA